MLNLLPPIKKQDIKNLLFWQRCLNFAWIFIFAASIFGCLLATTWLYNYIQYKAIVQLVTVNQASSQGQKIKDLEANIRDANNNLDQLTKLDLARTSNFKIIEELIYLLPPNIKLNSLSLNRANNQGSLAGHADQRQDLLTLKANLENSDYFKQIDLPLNNILKENNIDFSLSFSLSQ